MQNKTVSGEQLKSLILACGAGNAAVIAQEQIVLSEEFRAICEGNACGNYGQCYMCPPDIGEISELIAQVRTFGSAVLYQKVYTLEDSFDFEGMNAAGAAFNALSVKIQREAGTIISTPWLHLAAGGCRSCETCAKRDNIPCRKPDEALSSLEAYGTDVYRTSENAGLKYINGENTVTYFGMLLFHSETVG